MPSTLDLLVAQIGRSPDPFVTFYDDETGERVELSGVTTANWVSKTANLLVDELDAGPRTRVRLGLPSHWQRVVWLLASWAVGAAVVDHDADIGVSGPELQADEANRVAASLRPFGGPFADAPEGFLDLGREVPGQPDFFLAGDPPTESTLAVDLEGTPLTHVQLLAEVAPDGRRLMVEPGDVLRDVRLVVAAASGGGSLVVVRSAGADTLRRIGDQEGARQDGDQEGAQRDSVQDDAETP